MARHLLIITKSELTFYRVGKGLRPLTVVKKRLFNTSENLMIADTEGRIEMVAYDLEGTQPYGRGDRLEPDLSMAYIDSAKEAHAAPAAKLGGKILNSIGRLFVPVIVVMLIGYALINGALF